MMSLFFLLLGMFIGWFFLPAPQMAHDLRDWVLAKVPFLSAFARKDAEK